MTPAEGLAEPLPPSAEWPAMQGRAKMPRLDVSQYEMAFKVLVSPHAAGKIIGRGGSEIAELRRQLGVGCHIHGPENLFPNTGYQVAVLFGSRQNIDLSFEMLVGKIAEADTEMWQDGNQLTVVVVMTTNAVSAVIGTKGQTIASLRQGAGCGFSADKDLYGGEQLVKVKGPIDRLPGALSMLTPFAERSGDSLQYAMQEYGFTGCGGWGDGGAWAGPRVVLPMANKGMEKGMGKRTAPPASWSMPAWQAIGPGPQIRQRAASTPPSSWRPLKQARAWGPPAAEGGKGCGVPAGELEAPEQASAPMAEMLQTLQQLEEEAIAEDDPRVLGSAATMAFPIPKESIGRVLGRGGTASAEIRSATGASLQIEPGEREGTVTLSGALSAVHRAHRLVVARVLAKC